MCKLSLTSATINSFCSCRRAYNYKYNLGIHPLEQPKSYIMSAVLSEAMTNASVLTYKNLSKEEVLNSSLAIIHEKISDTQDAARCEAVMTAYVNKYYKEQEDNKTWEILEGVTKTPLTVKFNYNASYTVFIDFAVHNLTTNKIYVVVNKTSSTAITEDSIARYYIDNDIRLQIVALKQYLKDSGKPELADNVVGAIINTATRPQHKIKVGETDEEYAKRNAERKGKADLKRKVGETVTEFINRMVDEYDNESLKRHFIEIGEYACDAAVAHTNAVVYEMLSNTTCYYPNTSECAKYGACPYIALCRADGDLTKVNELYRHKD